MEEKMAIVGFNLEGHLIVFSCEFVRMRHYESVLAWVCLLGKEEGTSSIIIRFQEFNMASHVSGSKSMDNKISIEVSRESSNPTPENTNTHNMQENVIDLSDTGGKKVRSQMWDHFTKKQVDDGSIKAMCNYCSALLAKKTNSAVLDPPYKMTLIEFYLLRVYGDEYVIQLQRIRRFCYDLVEFYASKLTKHDVQSSSSNPSNIISATSFSGGSLVEFDSYVMQIKRSETSHSKSKLDYYLDEDVLPRRDDFDILLWWKVQCGKYQILQSIAKDILVVPVSTVASESAFNTSGRLVSEHRSRLVLKTIEALMCTQNWLLAVENEEGETSSSNIYATIHDDMDKDDIGTKLHFKNIYVISIILLKMVCILIINCCICRVW